jgi:hypothetical protein
VASVTGEEIVKGAFALLNIYLPGEPVNANDGEYARTTMNDLLSEWNQRSLMIPLVVRERFHTVAGQGGPSNPYTIGPGGDWDTDRPSNQDSIEGANLILTASTPEVRITLGSYTDQAYFFNQIPDLPNTQPTSYYYNATYANNLGAFYLWPVPTTSQNDVELLLQKAVSQFADLSSTYDVPDGVPRVLKYNLAFGLQGAYGKQMAESDVNIAMSSLAAFRRTNMHLMDIPNDANFGRNRNTIYNILVGNG